MTTGQFPQRRETDADYKARQERGKGQEDAREMANTPIPMKFIPFRFAPRRMRRQG